MLSGKDPEDEHELLSHPNMFGCHDHHLDKKCAAILQGNCRLERMLAYLQYLKRLFPGHQPKLLTVPRVGHSGCKMYHASNVLQDLFQDSELSKSAPHSEKDFQPRGVLPLILFAIGGFILAFSITLLLFCQLSSCKNSENSYSIDLLSTSKETA